MDLKDATEESLSTPTELLKAVFIFDTTMSTEIEKWELKEDQFETNITDI